MKLLKEWTILKKSTNIKMGRKKDPLQQLRSLVQLRLKIYSFNFNKSKQNQPVFLTNDLKRQHFHNTVNVLVEWAIVDYLKNLNKLTFKPCLIQRKQNKLKTEVLEAERFGLIYLKVGEIYFMLV